jgi:hypothetical protein
MTRSSGNRGGILKILLIVFAVIAVIVIGCGIYVATHWKGWAADFANTATAEIIKESGLPQDQQNAILAEVDRLGDDFRNGRIDTEGIARVAKAVAESPLLPLGGVQMARTKYIEPSDMTEKEKAEATLSLQRFARGVFEKKIQPNEIDDVIKPITELKENGRWQLKDNPTRMEVDQFVANAKARADDAKIPEEPFEVNVAEELKKAIRSAAG